jgi:N-(5'phosphoribosyl)anthranilate (PRA) isomerase
MQLLLLKIDRSEKTNHLLLLRLKRYWTKLQMIQPSFYWILACRNWSIAEELQNAGLPVIVAGGLHAESVATCIQQIRPFGVDVSSGVEASGTKT